MTRSSNGRYSKEFRCEAVKLVVEGSISAYEASRQLSLPKSTLENWVRAFKAGKLGYIGGQQRPLTDVEHELDRVKRELAQVKQERDILKKAGRVLCEGVAARYAVIKELRCDYPVPELCRTLEVSTSGYYDWLKRPDSPRQKEEARLVIEIKAAHKRNRETYGPERLQNDLAEHGIQIGVHRIKRIRRVNGIRCKQVKKFKATTNSSHSLPVAENLLEQNFATEAPNQVWVSDITYISTAEGWLYLAGHKDLFTGEVVEYAMGDRMTKNLVSQSLFRATSAKRPAKGLIHHSDRGSQYCALEYRKLLEQFGMQASMSRRGNCYDNAPIESFWGILKNELVHHHRYATRQEAIREITEYIEIFYNRQRRQARLGYLSPAAYERKYLKELQAA
ncbi:IS3 family transposase [Geobacter chapellei]|uniref:IS3 family transposase n=1 Tax=Pelotalea chapellei TaxID=44671 RepID=A0ABS5UBG1_9BACT|nr:IS3 family transposase [Pelotalea chapellei]MBT1072983.1 IS3 family transposase [Pelotalea chapellei]